MSEPMIHSNRPLLFTLHPQARIGLVDISGFSDLERALRFYFTPESGFELTQRYGDGQFFGSSGGYTSHIASATWEKSWRVRHHHAATPGAVPYAISISHEGRTGYRLRRILLRRIPREAPQTRELRIFSYAPPMTMELRFNCDKPEKSMAPQRRSGNAG